MSSNALGPLLKSFRRRIDRGAEYLGEYRRLSSRRGRLVTQQEIADAVNVSREWYAALESDAKCRASPSLLVRIAAIFTLSDEERAELFRLALPEASLPPLQPNAATCGLLEAFRSLRTLGRTLWTASTEAEALTLVREYGVSQFGSDLVASSRRSDSGGWTDIIGTARPQAVKRWEKFDSFVRRNHESFLHELHLTTILSDPGDVITRCELSRSRDFSKRFEPALDVLGFRDVNFMMARVRSRLGFVANIRVVHESHEYSDVERAHLGAIAQLASLAITGSAGASP